MMTWQGEEKKTKQKKEQGPEAEAHVNDLAGRNKEDKAGKGTRGARPRLTLMTWQGGGGKTKQERNGGPRPRLTLMTWQGGEKKTKQEKERGGRGRGSR